MPEKPVAVAKAAAAPSQQDVALAQLAQFNKETFDKNARIQRTGAAFVYEPTYVSGTTTMNYNAASLTSLTR